MGRRGYERTLGGDEYLVTLPSHRLLYDIMESELCPDELIPDLWRQVLCQEQSTVSLRAFVPFVSPSSGNGNPDIWQNLGRYYFWNVPYNKMDIIERNNLLYRPVLIPLQKNGKWDKSFKQQNPNGSVVTGFHIQWIRDDDNESVPFVVDVENDCRWIWWEGILVMLDPKGTVDAAVLHKMDLLNDSLQVLGTKFI